MEKIEACFPVIFYKTTLIVCILHVSF